MDIRSITSELQMIFGLNTKPGIIVVPRIRIWGNKRNEAWGFYYSTGKCGKFRHVIKVATNGVSEIQMYSVLAHEYTHAWQTEQVWKTERREVQNNDLEHGEKTKFQLWVRYFKHNRGVDIVNMCRV